MPGTYETLQRAAGLTVKRLGLAPIDRSILSRFDSNLSI